MVRINIINPRKLSDQHLIAEYLEIIMLCSYAKKHKSTDGIPESYRLGEGHIKFFKNKIAYLKKRHDSIRDEMKRRGFNARKRINLNGFDNSLLNDWTPNKKDFEVINKRIIEKIELKPEWYRHYGENKNKDFFVELMEKS